MGNTAVDAQVRTSSSVAEMIPSKGKDSPVRSRWFDRSLPAASQ